MRRRVVRWQGRPGSRCASSRSSRRWRQREGRSRVRATVPHSEVAPVGADAGATDRQRANDRREDLTCADPERAGGGDDRRHRRQAGRAPSAQPLPDDGEASGTLPSGDAPSRPAGSSRGRTTAAMARSTKAREWSQETYGMMLRTTTEDAPQPLWRTGWRCWPARSARRFEHGYR